MTGTYTEITRIWTDKDTYNPGDPVSVSVLIKNLYSHPIHIYCVAVQDGERFIDLDEWVSAGLTYTFGGYFTMPDQEVTITAYSWYEGADGHLYHDDTRTKDVPLAEEPVPEFSQFAIADYHKV